MLTAQERICLKTDRLSVNFNCLELVDSRDHPSLVESPNSVILGYAKPFAVINLEEFRLICGDDKPVKVDSWYRNPKLNKEVGGEKKSIHMILDPITQVFNGVAADLVPQGISIFDAFKRTVLLKSNFMTFILYPKRGFIHCDTNTHRHERCWFISMDKGGYDPIQSIPDIVNIRDYLKQKYNFACKE